MLGVIPFRLGELSYIHGFKKHFGKSYLESTGKLIKIRFADYIIVYILMLISSIYVSTQVDNNIVKLLSVFFFISLIFFLGFIFFFSTKKFNLKNKKVLNVLFMLQEGIKNFKKISLKDSFYLISFTFIYWTLRLVMGFIILLVLGVNISFFSVMFISLVLLLVGLLPIQTFMNFGIFEGGWAYFLVNFGLDYNLILPKILIYHLVLLFIPSGYGILSYFLIKLIYRNRN